MSGQGKSIAAVAALGVAFLIVASAPAVAQTPSAVASGWTWEQLDAPKETPALCFESAAAFDTSVNRLVLWGGHGPRYSGSERADTWLYDPAANTWELAEPSNRPVGACCVREMVYDSANRASYYFGGHSFAHGWQWRAPLVRGGAGSPWAYDATANTWRCTRPMVARDARPWTGAAYDSGHQVVVVYGGQNVSDRTVWVYDGYANTWTAVPRQGEGPDVGGRVPPMVYDSDRRVVLMHGDQDRKGNDLWAYDLASNSWRKLEAANSPPSGYVLFVYDPLNRLPILFGRDDGGRMAAFAYHWDRKAWERLEIAGTPPPGYSVQQGAYDPTTHSTLFANGGTYNVQNRPAVFALRHARPKDVPAVLPAADDVRVVVGADGGAELSFKPVAGAAQYLVERGTGETPWQVQFARAGLTTEPKLADSGKVERGTIRYYRVTAVDAAGKRGATSLTVRTQPRAPAMPVVSVLPGGGVEVAWDKSPEPDVVGYNLYTFSGWQRAGGGRSPDGLKKLNDLPLTQTSFTVKDADPADGDGAGPFFVIHAVNRAGVESGPSPWADTIITEPTGLLAREVDGKVTLTWNANPQKGVRGYNVYRVDSGGGDARKLANKIAGPVSGARFVDESKTDRRACKYYLTAIDAAGREGRASYGAWFNDDGRN